MLYLLDANTLIDANRDYYPIGRVDEFWAWLLDRAESGHVKLPQEAYEEISAGNDEVAQRVKARKETLLLNEAASGQLVGFVVSNGYAPDLTDEEVITVGRDPFLIAYALAGSDRAVVTTERSRPKARRANRKIPDVCAQFKIEAIDTFELVRRLDFRTNWRQPIAP